MGLGLYIAYRKIKNNLTSLSEHVERNVIKLYEIKKVRNKKRKNLYAKLTDEQKRAIDKFYLKNWGEKIPYNWHQLYTSFTGNFDEKYFPDFLYSSLLERIWNTERYKYALEDKNLLPLICQNINGVVTPKLLVSCVNGLLRDEHYNIINEEIALDILKNYNEVFVKPSIGTCSGNGCKKIRTEKISINVLKKIYNGNFSIQEIIKNHKVLKDLYPYGVNTFRVISYIWNDKINLCPVALRLGKDKNYLDNVHAGGISVGVKESGELMPYAFTEFQEKFSCHPDTKVVFNDYLIPQYKRILESVKLLHANIPYLGIIHWDITIDENNNIVVVEANTYDGSIWLPQFATGRSLFGDDTAGILQMLRKYK